MASMAKWGDIRFRVSSEQVFSFRKMKRSYSSRWATHDIIGNTPKLEFQGAALGEITIEVILDAELGVNPRSVMKQFSSAAKRGSVSHFYVGGRKVADHRFYIASGTENWNRIWNGGELVKATANITFKEYR